MNVQRRLFDEGIQERDEAIDRVAHGADRAFPAWCDQAYVVLMQYATANRALVFTSEDVRVYAVQRGLPVPPEPRAWGAVIMRARKAGALTPAGFTRSGNAQAHKRPIQQWRAT